MCKSNNKNSDDDDELLQLPEVLIFQYDYDSDNDSMPSLVSYTSASSTEFNSSNENNNNNNNIIRQSLPLQENLSVDAYDSDLENEVDDTKGSFQTCNICNNDNLLRRPGVIIFDGMSAHHGHLPRHLPRSNPDYSIIVPEGHSHAFADGDRQSK